MNEKLHELTVFGLKNSTILGLTSLSKTCLIKQAFSQSRFDLAKNLINSEHEKLSEDQKFVSHLINAELETNRNKSLQCYESAITEFRLSMNTTRLVRDKFMLKLVQLRKVWRQSIHENMEIEKNRDVKNSETIKQLSTELLKYTLDADPVSQNLINFMKDENYSEVLKNYLSMGMMNEILANSNNLQKLPYPPFFFNTKNSAQSSLKFHCFYPNNLSVKNVLRRSRNNLPQQQNGSSNLVFSLQCNGNLTCPVSAGVKKLKIILKIYVGKDTSPIFRTGNESRKRKWAETCSEKTSFKQIEKTVTLNSLNHDRLNHDRSQHELSDFKTVIAINQSDLTQLVFDHWRQVEQDEFSKFSKTNNKIQIPAEKLTGFLNVDIFTELLDNYGKDYFVDTEYVCDKEENAGDLKNSKNSSDTFKSQDLSSNSFSGTKNRKNDFDGGRTFKTDFEIKELLRHAEKYDHELEIVLPKGTAINSCYASTLSENLCVFDNVHSEFNEKCRIRVLF